jgi:hypothetical protein
MEVAYVSKYGDEDRKGYIGMNFMPSFTKIDKLMSVVFTSGNE